MAVDDVVRELLAAIPAGCTWLVPVTGPDGAIIDFRVAATSDQIHDIYGRGAQRVDGLLAELYPSMVDGPLWRLYVEVLTTGTPATMDEFRFEQSRPGVVADSRFEISVYPVLGGLLVWWARVDEHRRRLESTELLGSLGWAEHELATGGNEWSPGMYRIFERDPADGPLSRVEQAAAMLAEDRGIAEAAWQTLDVGATSDVTVRFRIGDRVKHLRILSDLAHDAAGRPVKIYAVVQDVTARVASRTEIERLSDQVRVGELTALAEHRLARQLQQMIQPVPAGPFRLGDLEAMVGYQPAESAVQVGGDWYCAQTLPDGRVVLAVGDVAGHGMEAASGMAHLRFALVGWLSVGIRDPGLLLRHLNRLCAQLGITGTAVVGVYDPGTGRLPWARAGHMAPMLGRGGRAVDLERPPGLLLGAEADTEFPVADAELRPGDLILFYTDGLVERRGDATRRTTEVRDRLSAVSAAPGPDPLPHIHRLLYAPSADDDTCTLAVLVRD
ncbi:magnesium/manganese-dependent protein phosphatase [Actinoplanes sp. SE50]|uniref:PP2C family protein-serine/threonine phosphatase n=1 Tax=unclassified Actinoplanes TaxID=2626549 RepID=UPI00023ED02A|nr:MULTISPECIES: PP2C family protein-serine/threonine phosphatase [unclassified Actinoplanes]AEV83296.1 Phosphoserine phosphatase rsbP [Actinoplanes sp. SE50/110]ATO81689.1 magnesium/manganese-dependent protein phosphatase [Actinoplanes sp. SE50]SLL99097.1 magnesium/manganese-dependent protein phosphatase [Actinoplanes sp. SE50/110]